MPKSIEAYKAMYEKDESMKLHNPRYTPRKIISSMLPFTILLRWLRRKS
jgi:hypothetical protein